MIPLRPFGSTGHASTRVIFGAAALGGMSQDRADATLEAVRSAGVNHIDTAASYGESELRLAPWLADHRDDVFLATKTGERNGADARAELERSLARLDVDHVDLIQLHNLVEEDEWQTAFEPGGVVEAVAHFLEQEAGNPGRGGHRLTVAASRTIEGARDEIASLLGAHPVDRACSFTSDSLDNPASGGSQPTAYGRVPDQRDHDHKVKNCP